MVSTRNKTDIKDELIRYILELGIDIKTKTKARGHNGFFKEGRIDISKSLDEHSFIKTALHEFGHYIHFCFDDKFKNAYYLFDCEIEPLLDELMCVTNFVDENSLCKKLVGEREKIKKSIKDLTASIRQVYPKFNPSEKLKQFSRYAMWSNLSYLENHDRVKLVSWFSSKIYSISNVRKDFPNIPDVFVNYLKLKSKQRKRARITNKISKLNKYYSNPSELFARFIEGLYLDCDMVKALAPTAYERFLTLYENNYYPHLKKVFEIVGVEIIK